MGAATMNMSSLRKVPLFLQAQYASSTEHISEEFDFSDVFGPVPLSVPLAPGTEVEDTARDPPVIYSRSHSLVGPSPRPILTRPQGKPIWDDPEHVPVPEEEIQMPFSSSNQESDQLPILEVMNLALSDSGDSGSERGVEELNDDVQKPSESEGVDKLGPQDFERLRVVGQGAFGKVFQVQKKGTSEIYAMKVMRKDKIMERNHGDYMKAERDILTKVVHPFIVQLRYSFQVWNNSAFYCCVKFFFTGNVVSDMCVC
jgi:p70 ribosomal S6 kinase